MDLRAGGGGRLRPGSRPGSLSGRLRLGPGALGAEPPRPRLVAAGGGAVVGGRVRPLPLPGGGLRVGGMGLCPLGPGLGPECGPLGRNHRVDRRPDGSGRRVGAVGAACAPRLGGGGGGRRGTGAGPASPSCGDPGGGRHRPGVDTLSLRALRRRASSHLHAAPGSHSHPGSG